MTPSYVGSWSYRSFANDPDLSVPFNDLRCGMGEMILTEPEPGRVGGSIEGPGWSLDLEGTATKGDPDKIRFRRSAEINGERWVYEYLCYVVPDWAKSGRPINTMVGSIVMKQPGAAKRDAKECVGSWYAVRNS